MDLRILEIASHTDNNKVLKNPTHQSKNKNPICGDEMEISLIVKDNIVKDMGYQCNSCVYCQASVSLLSRKIRNRKIKEINEFVENAEKIFDDVKIILDRNWKDFTELLDKSNVSRKECLLLPLKTVFKALKI
jgi:nitrogen fixation protein NifU and related proteins